MELQGKPLVLFRAVNCRVEASSSSNELAIFFDTGEPTNLVVKLTSEALASLEMALATVHDKQAPKQFVQ